MPGDPSKTQRATTGELRPARGGAPAPLARASLDRAITWIDAHSARVGPEEIDLDEAAGRVVASEILARTPIPPADRAAADGYAVRAAETVGAGDYNPLRVALCERSDELPPSSAMPIISGAALPRGADSVLPSDLAHFDGAELEVFGAVPQGWGIVRQGQQLQAGSSLVKAGRALLPQHIGLLASAGIQRVQVLRRPRLRLCVFPPKPHGADANTPMLRALIERDGGIVDPMKALEVGSREALARALAAGDADLTLVAGRSGHGVDDMSVHVLEESGELAIHDVALRPGGSSSMGLMHGAPVLLLPGSPLECWSAYEMLAGRLIRRIGGRSPELPYAKRQAEVGNKIVSAIGVVDVCRVRLSKGTIEPVGPAESGGLASAAHAHGFVLVPAPLEGFAPGSRVDCFVFDERDGQISLRQWPAPYS